MDESKNNMQQQQQQQQQGRDEEARAAAGKSFPGSRPTPGARHVDSDDEEDDGNDASRQVVAGTSKMLGKLGLSHNPYVDRTAEKSILQSGAFYLLSDLQGFRPSEMTYIFFGKRGSGKTTIRLMMMQRYKEYNERRVSQGKNPVFVVNLCRPGHMNDCLKQYRKSIGADKDNWDASFADNWSSSDLADCVISFAINDMMRLVVTGSPEGRMILSALSNNPRSATQFLILAHLYTREDSATLNTLRAKLLPIAFSSVTLVKTIVAAGVLATTLGAAAMGVRRMMSDNGTATDSDGVGASRTNTSYSSSHSFDDNTSSILDSLRQILPEISQTQLTWAGVGASSLLAGVALQTRSRSQEQARAKELCAPLRIGDPRADLVEPLLNSLFTVDDTSERIRALHIGHSAQQKLELIDELTKSCGFQGMAVFGDCFDEVGLLDPLLYPSALKVFAREVCKNEVLNQGRLHFFFPDARASLDLSTDRIVREARFDRHFVRDLTWSRFQLEELAERRFLAAQKRRMRAQGGSNQNVQPRFQDLFKHVSKEDFSGAISKLSTPRELMVFMTELLGRVEAHSEDGAMVAAQDMEIAVNKAQEQSV
ncbi:Hypothetical Protein FCC1311_053402 [Hondaea fermentalgiana]|uniref:Uncharacterized protein n=1 Tax=Hondaea fermentalgiana TaxID=2315210 RepID=A0A2R5GDV7_9STRA|nr:Hypothetical Protein FCC1311_053402 [Hondaea fermentalgiana]|eukprot:GBG29117.1 Hypothetical Protein FCC1311_053402 [Hondaea fermentalgiana]